jgi:hypothetical protein
MNDWEDRDTLTEDEERVVEEVRKEYLAKSEYVATPDEVIVEAVREFYRLGGEKEPEVVVCGSPLAMKEAAKRMFGDSCDVSESYYGNLTDFGWLAMVDAGERLGITKKDESFARLRKAIVDSGLWSSIQFEGIAFACRRPPVRLTDENGDLHSLDGPAVIFEDKACARCVHGVHFTKEQFDRIKAATASDILSWEDIDQRSVLLRDRPVHELLDSVKDKRLIDHTDECGGYDLYELAMDGLGKCRVLAYRGWTSDKPYAKFVSPNSEKCLETVAKLRHQTVEQLTNSVKS